MKRIISIDLHADFGMLKKPDTNEPIYLTFNMLHKPALLGMLGAIVGLSGFKEKGKLPDYYFKLKDIQVAIKPLNDDKGNFQKTIITYNNSTGLASKETGGNLMVTEQTLVAPSYRCFFMLDQDNELHSQLEAKLSSSCAEYIPYLGKNEFSVWWDNFNLYSKVDEYNPVDGFNIESIYIKRQPLEDGKSIEPLLPMLMGNVSVGSFSYFECLPTSYDEDLLQYNYKDFAYTDWPLKADYQLAYPLYKIDDNEIVQFF